MSAGATGTGRHGLGAVLERDFVELIWPERHRVLMWVLLTRPGLDYQEITKLTGIPTGGIGPIRGRCPARMAGDSALRALRDPSPVSQLGVVDPAAW